MTATTIKKVIKNSKSNENLVLSKGEDIDFNVMHYT